MIQVAPYSREVNSDTDAAPYSGTGMMMYIIPTSMVPVETEKLVGAFSAVNLLDAEERTYIGFMKTNPMNQLSGTALAYNSQNGQWEAVSLGPQQTMQGPFVINVGYQNLDSVLKSLAQFLVPTNPTMIGVTYDNVYVQDYNYVVVWTKYTTDPQIDAYVAIVPQIRPVEVS